MVTTQNKTNLASSVKEITEATLVLARGSHRGFLRLLGALIAFIYLYSSCSKMGVKQYKEDYITVTHSCVSTWGVRGQRDKVPVHTGPTFQ